MHLRTSIPIPSPNMCSCSSNEFHFILYIDVKIEELYVRCCGANDFDTGFQDWRNILSDDVPDSCCHIEHAGCGTGKIRQFAGNRVWTDLGIWRDGCLEILQIKIRNDVVPMLIVYAGVGVLLGIVELITIVLACAYVAQIGRRVKRDRHTHRYTQPGPAGEEEYLPSLNAKETNF